MATAQKRHHNCADESPDYHVMKRTDRFSDYPLSQIPGACLSAQQPSKSVQSFQRTDVRPFTAGLAFVRDCVDQGVDDGPDCDGNNDVANRCPHRWQSEAMIATMARRYALETAIVWNRVTARAVRANEGLASPLSCKSP